MGIDVQSELVSDVVRKCPWWSKLEFQLECDQSQIMSFRTYLGNVVFNNLERFYTVCSIVPILSLLAIMLLHLHHVTSDPFIFLDVWKVIPQLCLSMGILVIANLLALSFMNDWFAFL